jgi:hypothetical protein
MRWKDGTSRFDLDVRGDIEFTDDLSDVATMTDGGYLKLRDWSGVIPHTIEIRSSGGAITRKFYVGGVERPFDDEARRWMAEKLPALVRRSGIGAAQRVRSIFAKRGLSGVLDEIRLLGGDYARMKYFTALVDTARLDPTSLPPVLRQIGELMTSDYEKSQVLQHIAAHVRLDRGAAQAYVRAIGGMRSDYEKRRVLTDVLTRGPLPSDARRGFLSAAATIDSDYDCAQVVTRYVRAHGVDSAARQPFFAALGTIDSDFDRRRVLTELARKGSLAHDVQQSVFDFVGTMHSDYDRAEILLAFVNAHAVDAASRQAFVKAAERINSSHDQNRVLAALVRTESAGKD